MTARAFLLALVLAACGGPPSTTALLSAPPSSGPPAPPVIVPVWCPGLLEGPDPDTVDGLRHVLLCERLTAADGLQRAARRAWDLQADLERNQPPSRVAWLSIGAAAALLLVGGVEVAR